MDFSKGVLFDPGYSRHTLAFAQNIDAAYNLLFTIKAFNQRKLKFRTIYPQLLKLLEHTVSFYLGCLLWATFISKNFKNDPKEILENGYIGETVNEEQMLYEVNYAIKYIDKLKKDCKYYLGQTCNLPDDWAEVMEVYKEFLMKNNFLVSAKSTSDLLLPETIKDVSEADLEAILKSIEEVVSNGQFKDLFKVKKLII